jgi:hypothetical protein
MHRRLPIVPGRLLKKPCRKTTFNSSMSATGADPIYRKTWQRLSATDTHWLPGAMEAVAGELGPPYRATEFPEVPGAMTAKTTQASRRTVVGQGDIARMLTLPQKHVALCRTGGAGQSGDDRSAGVLAAGQKRIGLAPSRRFLCQYLFDRWPWLGRPVRGWPNSSATCLQQPIDLLARNDSGAYVTREMLAGELARGRDRLAGKKAGDLAVCRAGTGLW